MVARQGDIAIAIGVEFEDRASREITAFRKKVTRDLGVVEARGKQVSTTAEIIDRTFRDLGRSRGLEAITETAIQAAREGVELRTVLQGIEKDLRQIGATDTEIRSVTQQVVTGAGAGRGAGLQAFGREARVAVPAVNIPGVPVSTEMFARFAEVAGRLGVSFKDLAVGGLAVVGVAIAMKVAFDKFIGPAKEFTRLTKGLAEGQQEFFRDLPELTTAAAREQIQALEVTQEGLRLEREELEAQIARGQAILAASGDVARGAVGAFGLVGTTPIEVLQQRIEEMDVEVKKAETSLELYQDSLSSSTVIANDATEAAIALAEAEEELAEQRKAVESGLQQIEVSAFVSASSQTREEIEARIQALRDEGRALGNFQRSQFATEEGYEASRVRLVEMNRELAVLEDVLSRTTVAEEGLAKALERKLGLLDQQLSSELQFAQFARTATVKSIDARREALNTEAAAIKGVVPQLTKLAETSDDAADRLDQLKQRLSGISQESANLERALPSAVERGVKAAKEEISKLRDALTDRLGDITARLSQREASIRATVEKTTAANARKAITERTTIQRKGQIDEQKALENHLEQVADIERRFTRGRESAIQNRDAVALDAAITARQDEKEAEDRAFQKRINEIDDAMVEQNRVVSGRLTEQNRIVAERGEDQLDVARKQAAQQKREAVSAANDQIALKRAEIIQLQSLTQSGAVRTVQIHANMFNSILSFGSIAAARLNEILSSASQQAQTAQAQRVARQTIEEVILLRRGQKVRTF